MRSRPLWPSNSRTSVNAGVWAVSRGSHMQQDMVICSAHSRLVSKKKDRRWLRLTGVKSLACSWARLKWQAKPRFVSKPLVCSGQRGPRCTRVRDKQCGLNSSLARVMRSPETSPDNRVTEVVDRRTRGVPKLPSGSVSK